MVTLSDQQLKAIGEMKNGCLLVADGGTGKSRTALAYYYLAVCEGKLKINGDGYFKKPSLPRDLYIITTAKKRDSLEWEEEMSDFCLLSGENKELGVTVTVDSWNNIQKYKNIVGAFFIFDEQRVVGWGKWSKTFVRIARRNKWILLTGTPADTWSNYMPVFVANGFYKDKTDFERRHAVFSRFSKYPQIIDYFDEGTLLRHENDIVVRMVNEKDTVRHVIPVRCSYDRQMYRKVWRDRWDPYDNCPIEETGKLFYLLRKVVNSDRSRLDAVRDIYANHKKLVVFYNYTYELHMLRDLFESLGADIGEWNGEVHSSVPISEHWVYLVQYSAGAEGWNCITTDSMIFFSQSYSYRMTVQAEWRIDRFNTPYKDLYYYKLKSDAPIDNAIAKALSQKKNFNEKNFFRH